MAPSRHNEAIVCLRENLSLGIVFTIVLTMALVILVGVLNHGEDDYENERWRHRRLAIANRDLRDHLHKHDDQEVQIGKLFRELLEQIEEDEVVPPVLASSHHIVAHIFAFNQFMQGRFIEVDFAQCSIVDLTGGCFISAYPCFLTHFKNKYKSKDVPWGFVIFVKIII